MTWFQRLWRRKKMEEELEKELRFHLEQHKPGTKVDPLTVLKHE
jgi:hypothetical protein